MGSSFVTTGPKQKVSAQAIPPAELQKRLCPDLPGKSHSHLPFHLSKRDWEEVGNLVRTIFYANALFASAKDNHWEQLDGGDGEEKALGSTTSGADACDKKASAEQRRLGRRQQG